MFFSSLTAGKQGVLCHILHDLMITGFFVVVLFF